ncbi:MAG: YHYH protein, partial [Rhodospirillaceae bacterium]
FGDPGGQHDGTFVVDYEFVKGAGDLDACNGKRVTTPDFPDGTYAYFLTQDWPVTPRCFNAAPDQSCAKRRGGPPPGRPHPGGPPPHPPRRF